MDSSLITLVPRANRLLATHGTTTFIGKRQRSSSCTATATLQVPSDLELKAGLTLYKEDIRHVDIYYDSNIGRVRLEACFKLKGEFKVIAEIPITAEAVQMQIRASTLAYESSIRTEAETGWTLLGSSDALELVACDFNGAILDIFASTTSNEEKLRARVFGDFSVS